MAVLAGYDLHSPAALAASLAATLLGAGLFALTRSHRADLPQEALIGITYVVAAAASILILDRSPHGAEHIKTVLVGQILWVSWADIGIASAVYVAVGILHWTFRRRFLQLSGLDSTPGPKDCGPVDDASGHVPHQKWWDFLFYVSFGLVITVSVPIAGVLLVFTFLIVPAVCAVLFGGNLPRRLTLAWALGFVVSVLGCGLSFGLDTPTGATIVCAFGAVLALLGVGRMVLRRTEPHTG